MSNSVPTTTPKHVFVAWKIYSESPSGFRIILAEDLADAKSKAIAHYKTSFVSVHPLTATNTPDVYNF